MNRYKQALKILLDRQNTGKNLTILPDDIYLVSYPKSGNTWLRFLIGNLLYADSPVTFANVELKVPDIYQNTDEYLLKCSRPRLLKSHEPFSPGYEKVIYIVRDPRDVLVSYFFHAKKFHLIAASEKISDFIPMFLSGSLDGYGSWGEHVGSWVGARSDNASFFLIKYEDMLTDTFNSAKKINDFLCLNNSDADIQKAIDSSSADHMRKLEKKQGHEWKATKKSDVSVPFVRSATSGKWREHLGLKESYAIEETYEKHMKRFGYI